MTTPRAFASASPLPNGEVLIAGGTNSGASLRLASAELFDPATGTFSAQGVGEMTTGRMTAAAAPLPDGDVLIAGGAGAAGELSSAELFVFPPSALPSGFSSRVILHVSRDITRTVSRQGRLIKVTRTVTVTRAVKSTPVFTTTPARAVIARGGHVYAKGTAEFTRLVLSAHRRVPGGRYSLTLRHRYGRRWLTTHSKLQIKP